MTFNAGIEAAALLPCPFCGGKADFECIGSGEFITWSVGCMNSDVDCIGYQMIARFNRKCEAAAAWNTRPSSGAPVEQREAVARIIHPEAWEDLDDLSPTAREIWNNRVVDMKKEARSKADAILSLPGSSRDEVLEEAAKVAESDNSQSHFAISARVRIARRIRALKSGVAK